MELRHTTPAGRNVRILANLVDLGGVGLRYLDC